MPIEIKYTGTQQRWPELATTGKQSVWMPGQIEERDDVEAGKLLATGLFKTEPQPLYATLSDQGVVLQIRPKTVGPQGVVHPGVTLHDFLATPDVITPGSESKVTIDATSKYPGGTGCAVITETVSGNQIDVTWDKKFTLSDANTVDVWVYIDDVANRSAISLYLYAGSANYVSALTYDIKSGWNNIKLPFSRFSAYSGATKSMSFTSIKWRVTSAAGKVATVKLGALRINAKSRRGVCFTFDDSYLSDYTHAYQILKKYGYTGMSYFMPHQIGTLSRYLTTALMQEMYAGGWRFGLHNDVNWQAAGPAAARTSVVDGRTVLWNLGIGNHRHASYPENKYDDTIINMLQEEGVRWCRTVIEENQSCPVVSPMLLRGTAMKLALADNIALINAAMESWQTLIFINHEIGYVSSTGQDPIMTPEVFEATVKYCADNAVPVLNLEDWCAEYESGGSSIG